MKFRKKPVEIEAINFTRDRFYEVVEFTNGKAKDLIIEKHPYGKAYCRIETLEGEMLATESDWIIKGVQGEFYPCKPDIFVQTYEPCKE